jgi:hypothetical protein
MTSYLTDEDKLAGVYITEKVDRKTGWQFVCLEEKWTRGYCRRSRISWNACRSDGSPAPIRPGLRLNYAAYWSAEEGRRVTL